MGLEKNHQEIELSGEKVTVRNLKALDYTFVGAMPDTLLGTFVKMHGKKNVSVQDMDPASAEFMVDACMRGIVKHPESFTISKKHPSECGEKEFSFYDLSNEDQAELMTAIFSGGEGLPLNFLEAVKREIGKNTKRADGEQKAS